MTGNSSGRETIAILGREVSKITNSVWIKDTVSHGLKLEFVHIPQDKFSLTPWRSSPTEQFALEEEVRTLCSKNVLVEVPYSQAGKGFYSPLFLIQKPDKSYRTIINLKGLNKFLVKHTFKMESINSAIKMLFNNCFMVVVDLKDAYYHVPIHADFQRYLRVAILMGALHIKGKENVAADFLSRNVLKQGEWSLNEDIFNLVVRRWGQPVVDLFATRNNRKVKLFCSLNPRENPLAVDAFLIKMGFSTGLCFPTTEPDTSSGEENQGGSSESHPYRPLLAQKNLVCLAQDNVRSGPLGTARDPELALSGTDLPSTSGGAPFDGVEFERSLLVGKGFSPNLVETLLKSRKQITTRIYSRTWRKFLSCSKFNIQDGVPIQQILEFLQKGFELKLSPSTLRVFCMFVAAKRTPFGTYGGVLKDHTATDLGENRCKSRPRCGQCRPGRR
ncbi:unnamed protein product [Ranitomeya imitator]|uniref:Reverse transcriptase domain-containing protein n=1 Tax=Ranitomeya imitator TaxID=111125 RepID=A0ABN9M4I1_9NEOB|nr:unnamed protein product [Ranitomeya imitator]